MENKKNRILRVLACLCAVAVLGTAGALLFVGAEQTSFTPSSFSNIYYRYHYVDNNSFGNWTQFQMSGSSASYSLKVCDNINSPIFESELFFPISLGSYILPNTYYNINFVFSFSLLQNSYDDSLYGGFLPDKVKEELDEGFYLITNLNPKNNGFQRLNIQYDENYFTITSSLTQTGNGTGNSNYRQRFTYQCNFHFITESITPTNTFVGFAYCPFLTFSMANYNVTSFNLMNYNSGSYKNPVVFTTSNCFYDTDYQEYLPSEEASSEDSSGSGEISGEISDNGVSDIVEGQKEAVEHGQDLEQSKAQEALNDQNENLSDMQSVFNVTTLGNSFGSLLNGLMYSGSDFHFYLPSTGQIPYLNAELWEQTEIPFKTYIDSIPAPIIAIIRFLAWFALAVFLFHLFKKILSYFRGGSDD